MSDKNPEVIRDPRIFINERTSQNNRTPFELSSGVHCDFRNAVSKPYQNYTAYSSTVEGLSDMVNKASEQCVAAFIVEERLFKCVEDVSGNVYLLFKDIDNENTINDKRNFLGKLFVFDSDRNPVLNIDSLVVEDLELKNVNVFYDKIVLVGEDQVWFTESENYSICSIGYMSHFNVIADEEENPLFILDQISGTFNIKSFDGKTIKNLSEDLTEVITSSVLNTKEGRFELFITDSDINQALRVYEYDFSEEVWDGVEFPDFPYELLGGYSKDQKWYAFFEQTTYPNYVGGNCYSFDLPEDVDPEDVVCVETEDVYLTYPFVI